MGQNAALRKSAYTPLINHSRRHQVVGVFHAITKLNDAIQPPKIFGLGCMAGSTIFFETFTAYSGQYSMRYASVMVGKTEAQNVLLQHRLKNGLNTCWEQESGTQQKHWQMGLPGTGSIQFPP
uniref:AlNc14C11G1371 protein n=1 Tax=Albugo laibachii Nc14 TaxID=890382 RepID=F0W2Z2_9STRA|nr:AlNc14C11G1371 [Albugo laibachii Nc14]|eukprot:CCA15429.1 AlNc14C11G1371 [Albugo laibachii Nc14]